MKFLERNPVPDVAASVSDARRVDWAEAESSAEGEEQKRMIRNFRVIANIAEIHRRLPERSEEETAPSPGKTVIETPWQWGHLELLELLGQGAYAEVYRAHETRLDRDVALKLYYHREESDTSAILKEGRLLARMRHPNIVTVHGADEHHGRVGIWMELVDGQNLSQLVRANGPFGAREAAGIGLDVCRAVAAIHKVGLLHRDIKAQNVMRESGGRILLLDLGFGSPQFMEETSRSGKTVAGTPVYMAPELFRGEPAGVRTDIYAVGVLLYFMTTGAFPYTDRDVLSTGRVPSRTIRDERPDLPDDFIHVVDRSISVEPEKRFASAGEMANALSRAIGVAPKKKLFPWPLWTAAAALIVLIFMTLWPPHIGEPPPPIVRTVAILPLNNGSDDAGLEFLTAGIVHGITSRLSRLEQLRVVSGISAERYRGRQLNAGWLGQELSVQTLVTGQIDEIDNQIVVHVELVDTRENRSLWGRRFVRKRGEILDLEEEFATLIAGALGVELREGQAEQLAKRYTNNPEAYELCQMGLFFADKRTRPDLQKALQYYQKAIDADPSYPQAYAGLGDTYALLGTGYFVADQALTREEAMDRARQAAQTAIQLDENMAEAHVSLALLDTIDSNWPAAEKHLQEAISISPSLIAAHLRYSRFLSFNGRHPEAIAQARKALELDPTSPLQLRNMGLVLYDARDYEAAIPYLRNVLEIDPEIPATRDILALSYWYTGQGGEAVAVYEETIPWMARYFRLLDAGRKEEALTVLEQNASTLPHWIRPLYTMLAGDQETALNQLEDLVAEGEPNVDMPLRERAFDHLVNDGRFLRMLEVTKVGWRYGVETMYQ